MNIKNLFLHTYLILLGIVVFVGCKEKGCTDPNATNYSENAQKNDNSCIYESNQINLEPGLTYKVLIDGVTYKMPQGPNPEVSYIPYFDSIATPFEVFKRGGYYTNLNTDEIYLGIYHYMSGTTTMGQVPSYDVSMFTPGNKNYYSDAVTNAIDNHYEVVIYLDNNFYSSKIKNDQSNNKFTILQSSDTTYNSAEMVKLQVELHCMVYNMNNPDDFKFISEAEAVILIEK